MGSLFALVAVILGAFGAHSLSEHLSGESLKTFEIGVRYQFYHAIAMFVLGALFYFRKTRFMILAGWSFALGSILFSGSLYLLSIKDIVNLGSWLGPITPLGGLLFILGWALLFLSTFQENELYVKKE